MIYTLKRDDIPSLSAWIKKLSFKRTRVFWRRHPDLNRGIKVLQTSALPLGYDALIIDLLIFSVSLRMKPGPRRPLPSRSPSYLALSRLALLRLRLLVLWVTPLQKTIINCFLFADHLAMTPYKSSRIELCGSWSGIRGSNPPPPPCQGGALPNELNPHMVPPVGIEPTTRRFSVSCSTI